MNEEEEYEEEEGEEKNKEKIKNENIEDIKKEEKIQVDDISNNQNDNKKDNLSLKKNNNILNKGDKNFPEQILFNKKLKNYEELSHKFDLVLNKLELNKKKKKENKNNNNNKQDNKILLEKEMQLKNSLTMIHNLTKENKKLKEQIDILNKKLLPSEDISLLEQISSKNEEIEKLNKKIIELNKKYNEIKRQNIAYETQLNQSKGIINRYKIKFVELKGKNSYNSQKFKIKLPKNFNIKENKKLLKSSSNIDLKKANNKRQESVNDNFYHLLTDKEKSSLRNLFGQNEEEYISFNKKLNILETRNKIAERNLESEIDSLNKIVKIKDSKIENLNKELDKKDKIINSLESKINELKTKNLIFNRNQKRISTVEEQLKESGLKFNSKSSRDKIIKLNLLVNRYKEELNKNYIEKCKEDEISKINKELGDIHFFDSKFFQNYSKNKDNNSNEFVK